MIAALMLAVFVQAVPTVVVRPNTPFQVFWVQPAMDGTLQFRFWCDGAIAKNFASSDLQMAPLAADGSMAITATVAAGLPAGNHSCLVSAFNFISEAKSDAIALPSGSAPSTPIQFRIIVNVGGGA